MKLHEQLVKMLWVAEPLVQHRESQVLVYVTQPLCSNFPFFSGDKSCRLFSDYHIKKSLKRTREMLPETVVCLFALAKTFIAAAKKCFGSV